MENVDPYRREKILFGVFALGAVAAIGAKMYLSERKDPMYENVTPLMPTHL